MASGRKDAHVGSYLSQDDLRRAPSHPGDALKQEALGLERGGGRLDALGQGRNVGFEVVDVGKHPFEQEGVVLAKAPGESLLELGELAPELAPGKLSHGERVGHPLDERPRHVASRCPHGVGGDRGQLDAGIFEGLVDAIHLRGSLFGEALR